MCGGGGGTGEGAEWYRRVHAVNVAESCRNGELRVDLGELLLHLPHLLRLGVKVLRIAVLCSPAEGESNRAKFEGREG